MKKLLFVVVFSFLFLVSSSEPVKAQEDFAVYANDYYEIDESGTALVKKNFQVVNLSTNVYPASYVLIIPQDAYNIVAFDGKGKIEPGITEGDAEKKVELVLNDIRPGVEQAVAFAMQYKSKQIAFLDEGSWKIIIAPENSNLNFIKHGVKVSFPDPWGEPSLVKPPSKEKYIWTMEEAGDTPIVISFKKHGGLENKKLLTTKEKQDDAGNIVIGVFLGIVITAILFFIVRNFLYK